MIFVFGKLNRKTHTPHDTNTMLYDSADSVFNKSKEFGISYNDFRFPQVFRGGRVSRHSAKTEVTNREKLAEIVC